MTTASIGTTLACAAGLNVAFAVSMLLQKAENPLRYASWTVCWALVLATFVVGGTEVWRRARLELLLCGATIIAILASALLASITPEMQTILLVLVVILATAFIGTMLVRLIPALLRESTRVLKE